MHVRRDEGNDTSVELNIVPAAAHHVEFDIRIYDAKYSNRLAILKNWFLYAFVYERQHIYRGRNLQ